MIPDHPHAEGGFGVTVKDITKDADFYTSTSRFVVWLGAFPSGISVRKPLVRQVMWLSQFPLKPVY
jgi:hypothetical protein